MSIELYVDDLPDGLDFGDILAVDTETLGLNPHRDRLCVIQLSAGDGSAHLVQFKDRSYAAPNLKAILSNPDVTKLFHFGRFDIAVIKQFLGIDCRPVYCTKIASKLVRTYTDRHGLRDICQELIGVEISKQQQQTDWGADTLSQQQLEYAASDVLYLHELKAVLDERLVREGRTHLAAAAFEFLPVRASLDLGGWGEMDIFAH